MKRLFLIASFLFVFLNVSAQYKVRFIVKETTLAKRDSIFITGTFNNWDSMANSNYKLQPYGDGEWSILLTLPAGDHSYKYSGGNWRKVEKLLNGDEVPNRTIKVNKDLVMNDTVIEWRDLVLKNKHLTLAAAQNDTSRLNILVNTAAVFAFNLDWYNADSALHYTQQAIGLLQRIKTSTGSKSWKGYEMWLLITNELNASLLHNLGNFSKSLELRLENLKLAEAEKNSEAVLRTLNVIGDDYLFMKDYPNALEYYKRAESVLSKITIGQVGNYLNFKEYTAAQIATCYFYLDNLDSALFYGRNNYHEAIINANRELSLTDAGRLLGDIHGSKNNFDSAFFYYRSAIPVASKNHMFQVVVLSLQGIAKLFQKKGQPDSALFYAKNALSTIEHNQTDLQAWGQNIESYTADLAPLIAGLYKKINQPDSAYKYLLLSVGLKEKLFNADKVKQVQNLAFNESLRQMQIVQQNKESRVRYETRIKLYSLIAGLAGLLLLAFILYRNNKQKQKANTLLESQKRETEETLHELRITQNQLIQSEKMASLGELTTGIAHEIQNPLNFVNNFSEVNSELIDEMQEEMDKGNYPGAKEISNDIKENEEKIKHHGKRADAIVKGMLQHSRASNGLKEPTDINALADEYLRLTYHGLRAKDQTFNTKLETDFDNRIGKINIIPQDIGRVILNLINNAFYVVDEKRRQNQDGYQPTVLLSTKRTNDKVEIRVKDNGNGIAQNVLDKIFQPFFTTKPTGQGTGLGLSLAYDIVKAHGGELKVENREGEGATFTIVLPG